MEPDGDDKGPSGPDEIDLGGPGTTPVGENGGEEINHRAIPPDRDDS